MTSREHQQILKFLIGSTVNGKESGLIFSWEVLTNVPCRTMTGSGADQAKHLPKKLLSKVIFLQKTGATTIAKLGIWSRPYDY